MKNNRLNIFLRGVCLLLVLCFACPALVSCKEDDPSGASPITFSQDVDSLEALEGKKVSIIGYMSTLSPVSGKFMYLMNLPYQSCPFCVPNTTQLSNTMAVYAKDKGGFEFTDRAIMVVGTLEFGDFIDEYGYTYNYRIGNATYSEVDTSQMSEKLQLWQALASTDVVAEIYNMYEYVNFCCFWYTYTAKFPQSDGTVYADYLYPDDARHYIEQDGAQYNYGFKTGYFDLLIAKVRSVDAEAFEDLVQNIEAARKLTEDAYDDLVNGRYTTKTIYSEVLERTCTQYVLTNEAEYQARMEAVYGQFSEWLSSWEL